MVPIVGIVAWAAVSITKTIIQHKQDMARERALHRERLAMIEQGMVPPEHDAERSGSAA